MIEFTLVLGSADAKIELSQVMGGSRELASTYWKIRKRYTTTLFK